MPEIKHKLAEASRDKWLAVAQACPYATYFHTPYWYDIIVPDKNYSATEVTFEDGASAVIPIAQIKHAGGLLTDNFSSPGGTYGGWISASSLSEDHIKILFDILTSQKNLTYRMNHLDKTSSSLIPSPNVRVKNESTHVIDLSVSEDDLYRQTSRCHKRGVRRASGEGVVIVRARSWEDWELYYALYESSLRRWREGGPELMTRVVYPRDFFRRLYDKLSGSEILWLAVRGGEPVAGLLCFYWNRHAVSWHGAAAADHFDLRPNNLLYWEVIRDAARRGCEVFDFNPSGGYEGVEAFKDRFGAARVSAPVLTTKTPLRSLISALRKKNKKK